MNGTTRTALGTRRGRHGRSRRRGLVFVALAGAVAGVLSAALLVKITGWAGHGGGLQPEAPPRPPAEVVGAGAPPSWPTWGFTHTQYTPDAATGFEQARADLAGLPVPQNQSIMGWGADNPEPSPGQFDFSALDRRVQLIRDTKGTPIITLCGAPDWMKGGAAGRTDWSKLEVAPTRAHYDDFARLAAEVAKRYPDVKYFVVWNEFKGFFDQGKNRWDYEGYTELYNKVYTALKNVNPDLQVGGPYAVMNSNAPNWGPPTAVTGPWGSVDQRSLDAVQYWLKNKKGADFLVVDGAAMPDQRAAGLGEFAELAKFSALTEWLRGQGGGTLPVWWAEWYVEPNGSGWTDEHRAAVQAAGLIELVKGGAATALYWSPQTATNGTCPGCLFSGAAGGGRATPTLAMFQNFAKWFPSGTRLVPATSSDPAVRVLAQKQELLAVNTSPAPVSAAVNGTTLHLNGYEVRWVSW